MPMKVQCRACGWGADANNTEEGEAYAKLHEAMCTKKTTPLPPGTHVFRVPVAFFLKAVVELSLSGDEMQATLIEGVSMMDQGTVVPSEAKTEAQWTRDMQAASTPGFPQMAVAHAHLLALTAARDWVAKQVAKESKPAGPVSLPQPEADQERPN